MRFRQVKKLFNTAAQTDTQPLAAAERDQRMRQLITAAESVRPRIHEPDNSLQPIRRGHDQHHERHRQQHDEAREHAPIEAAQKQDRHRNRRDHHQRAEIGFAQQQRTDEHHHRKHWQKALLEVMHEGGFANRVVGRIQHRKELHQLRRLHGHETKREPAARAIHFAADAGNQYDCQQEAADDKKYRCQSLPHCHRHLKRHQSRRDTQPEMDRVALQKVIHPIAGHLLGFRHGNRCRIDHHEADCQQQHHAPEQREIDFRTRCRRAIQHRNPRARAAS